MFVFDILLHLFIRTCFQLSVNLIHKYWKFWQTKKVIVCPFTAPGMQYIVMNKRVPMFGICGGCKAYGIDVIFFKNKYYPVQKVIVCPITASRLVSSICLTSLVWKFQKVIVCPFTAPTLQSSDVPISDPPMSKICSLFCYNTIMITSAGVSVATSLAATRISAFREKNHFLLD